MPKQKEIRIWERKAIQDIKETILEWVMEDELDCVEEVESINTMKGLVEFLGEHYPDSELYAIIS